MLIDRRVFNIGNDLSAAGVPPANCWSTYSWRGHRWQRIAAGSRRCKSSSTAGLRIDWRRQNAFLEQIPAAPLTGWRSSPIHPQIRSGWHGRHPQHHPQEKQAAGLSRSAQATPGTGEPQRVLSLNYKNEKFSVFSSASWNHRDMFRAGKPTVERQARQFILHRPGTRRKSTRPANGRLGMEWYPSSSKSWLECKRQPKRPFLSQPVGEQRKLGYRTSFATDRLSTKDRMDKDGTWTATTARSSTTTPSTS